MATWSVTAHVTACSNVTGTNTIAVSGGQFTELEDLLL